ncbi:wnt inhibitory factor 1 isoform X2 [Drosophila takahashii]|uniref:wnt inhibitory factor 1 isoform X2 n=1 Tax=Drosophila takahashii TaxID=29030 RepID=UPI001CF8655B|nr:wnt inhibitory factor 1 isoform X2 [Drosophila takahashii]
MQFSGPLAVFTALLTLVAFPALIQADSTELYGDIENTEYGDFESLSQTREQQKHLCHREVPNCENGFCESRYKCHCREGYHYNVNTTSCLPVCIDNCGQGNGVCIAPGVCRCFEGYEAHGADCRPKCQRSCGKFGRCVAPEICGCGQGQQHCRNGSCDDVEHCTCPAGETHFIDRCLKPDQLIQQLNTSEKRKHFNRQLAYEFNALIGRLFNF